MSLSEPDLITRALVDQDRHAFSALVRCHQSAVRGFLRRLTGGRHDLADDLAQETFIAAWRGLVHYRGETTFRSWLLGIAYNRFRSARRRERPLTSLDALPTADTTESPSPDARASQDLQQDLATALSGLDEQERAAIHGCFGVGLSHAEAAAVLAIPLGTLKTTLARAKLKLRARLRAWAPA